MTLYPQRWLKFDLSKFKIISGLFLGISYAFSFYAFLYLVRESYRHLALSLAINEHLILSDQEVLFFNFIFAFISLIIGQSICFIYWFDRPKRYFGVFYTKKMNLIHYQRMFIWFFLSWVGKICFIYGMIFYTFKRAYSLNIYEEYWWVFLLLLLVLFFFSWLQVRRVFSSGLKWMMFSFVSISALAFLFSLVQFTDYKRINENILMKNSLYKYNIEVPFSTIYGRPRQSSVIEIYVAKLGDDPIVIIEGEEYDFLSMRQEVNKYFEGISNYRRNQLIIRLFVDKGVKMKELGKVLRNISFRSKAEYAVYTDSLNSRSNVYALDAFPFQPFQFKDFFSKPLDDYPPLPPPPPSPFYDREVSRQAWIEKFCYNNNSENIFVYIKSDDTYWVSGKKFTPDEITQLFYYEVKKCPDYVAVITTDDEASFNTYFKFRESFRKAIYQAREEYAQDVYQQKWTYLSYENEADIREKFPIRIMEIFESERRFCGGFSFVENFK